MKELLKNLIEELDGIIGFPPKSANEIVDGDDGVIIQDKTGMTEKEWQVLRYACQIALGHQHQALVLDGANTPESVYESFWKDIVETDGVVDMEQVKKELSDFHLVMRNVGKVYCHITGGKVSKILTDPDVVIDLADDSYRESYEEAEAESVERLSDEDAAKEKLIQVHYWPINPADRDGFKAETGMRSRMVMQRGFTTEGYELTTQINEWIESVLKSHELPPGMEWMAVSEDSDLFWKTHAKN